MNPSEPAGVEVSLSRDVTIRWQDGHVSRYPIAALRQACPCATCQDLHHAGVAPTAVPAAAPANPLQIYQPTGATLERVQPVGRYALQFFFSDGHNTGIFTWEYLREICPCSACRAA